MDSPTPFPTLNSKNKIVLENANQNTTKDIELSPGIDKNKNSCSFTTKSSFKRRHFSTDHQRSKSFKCESCDKSFYEKWTLSLHIKTVHEMIRKILQCFIDLL